MGKFTGVLIASDFDNTLIYTENALKELEPMPELLPENREAIEYFMAQGGTFSIATGRALPSFNGVRQGLPMNGPTIQFNGAAIYYFQKNEYLYTAFLPDTVRPHITQVLDAWPEVAVELYYSTFALYTADLRKLFPDASATTLSRLKRAAREYTLSHGLMLIDNLSVPTDDAYKAWGLDIGKLEAKFKKLKNLGLGTAKEETA